MTRIFVELHMHIISVLIEVVLTFLNVDERNNNNKSSHNATIRTLYLYSLGICFTKISVGIYFMHLMTDKLKCYCAESLNFSG